MGFCPEDCADVTVNTIPSQCEPKERRRNLARIGFFPCTVSLPEPLTEMALQALVTAGKLAFTSPLANFDPQAPEYSDLDMGDCFPIQKRIAGRTIGFQDRFAIDKEATLSPVADPVPFFNYDFWQDKLDKQLLLRTLFVYCDGSVEIQKKRNGEYLEMSLTAYKMQENIGAGTSKYFIEYIVGELQYIQDPQALYIKPEEDGSGNVIDINGWGLF